MQVQLCGDGSDLPVFGKKQKADFSYQFGINHGSPAGAEDLDELPPASAKDAKEAMEPLLPTTAVQFLRLREGWPHGYGSQRWVHPAADIGN
jgi:hypothetical protein